MKTHSFVVSCTVPDAVTKLTLREYLRMAIRNWGGGGDPQSPFFAAFALPGHLKIEPLKPNRSGEE